MARVRVVRLMADHGAFPLWVDSGNDGRKGFVNDASPPISQGTRDLLAAWAIEYDRNALTNRWDDLVAEWSERGRALARRVAGELGTAWQVVYVDEITGVEERI